MLFRQDEDICPSIKKSLHRSTVANIHTFLLIYFVIEKGVKKLSLFTFKLKFLIQTSQPFELWLDVKSFMLKVK